MLRYGLPDPLPPVGVAMRALTRKEAQEEERRQAIGMVGLVLPIAGTLLQMVLRSPAASSPTHVLLRPGEASPSRTVRLVQLP
jgi:hypothetical protein